MNPFEMTVLIVAIVVIGRVVAARYARPAPVEREAPGTDVDQARLHDDIRALKARVATLERIVTDRSSTLDREIEALRDRD